MATIRSALPNFAAATALNLPSAETNWPRCETWINGRAATLIIATRELALSHAEVLRELLGARKR